MKEATRMVNGCMKERRVVVTGAGRGVGWFVTERFLREGARVLGVGRNPGHLKRAARVFASYGPAFATLAVDVTRPQAPARIAAAARRHLKAVDLLVNNAAINPGGTGFANGPDGELERTLDTNVLAVHRITRALLPLLLRGRHPRVVNVSSGAGNRGSILSGRSMSSYRLSKWTLNGLTRLWANELQGKVSVVMMDPGWVKTDMGGPDATDSPTLSAERALAIALLPPRVTGEFQVGAKPGSW